jgi:site-specific recombinase XerD
MQSTSRDPSREDDQQAPFTDVGFGNDVARQNARRAYQLEVRAAAEYAIPGARTVLLPFQFPSIGHLDDMANEIVRLAFTLEGLSPWTQQWVRGGYRSLRRFLVDSESTDLFLGGDRIHQEQILDGWVGALRSRGTKRSTINSYWRAMVFLGARLQQRHGVHNIFRLRPAPHPGNTRLRCLTRDEATRVLAWVSGADWPSPFLRTRNTALIAVMLLAGLRRSEALSLRAVDIDVEIGSINVIAGKGRNGGKPRTVPMTAQLRDQLAGYLEQRRRHRVVSESLFTSKDGTKPLPLKSVQRLFIVIEASTGIHVSPHMLRHTFCTLLSQAGMSDRLAMHAMGHSDLRMLQRYQHVYPGEVAREIQRLRLDV